jgi:thiol-disulfide isomerase/thioredoxin
MSESSPAPGREPNFVLGLLRDWAIAIVVVVVVFAGYNLLYRPSPPALGPAPAFVLADLEGNEVDPGKAGGVVVLNFWFTSCPPCVREIPELSQFHAENPDVPMYGISTDIGMPRPRLAAESRRLGISYPVLHDFRGEIAGKYQVDSFPTTLIVKDGQIVQARVGAVDRRVLSKMVAAAK